ncbi:MAG: argininosuccinate synthase [Bdellovibrionota bacterium]|nr:MAG: argininosuccinate synthase [Bdellovibrionota bacterium]
MNVHDLKGKTIAFAASGGLDSCTITRWLTDHGVKVVCLTADLGQPDEEDITAIGARMRACGAVDWALLPLREQIAEAGLKIVQAQATYEGRYWNTTGIARHVTVAGMLPAMRERKISILSHGATGRGNDQVRFQLVTNMLAPEMHVYAPWRDPEFLKVFRGRSEMIEFCEKHRLPIRATRDKPYSTDANLLGLTHEAGKLESLEIPAKFITPGMGCHAHDAPDTPERFSVRFEGGRPVTINDKRVSVLEAFEQANMIGGRHGVGIAVHLVENRFVGIKSRGVYEGPGIELLGSCYDLLLQLVLDRRSRQLFDDLSLTLARQIYQGYNYDLASQMAWSAVDRVADLITGTVTVELHKGRISFLSATETPHCLYSESNASMEAVGEFDHADSEGFLRVLAVSARALAAAKQIRSP